MSGLTIGKLATAADVKVPTIRFYEQIGLMAAAHRTASDRRVFDPGAVKRLAFIKHARQLGFPIEAIRVLLDLTDDPQRACDDANALAKEQLDAVETKIAQLQALRSELKRMVDARCQGPVGDCRVIETLADHSLCAHEHEVVGRLG